MNNVLTNIVKKFEDLSFIVIGDAMLDTYITGTAERLCREAPVPIVAVEKRYEYAGGAANTAANIADLGAMCYFISVVGNDTEGNTLKNILKTNGIDITGLQVDNRMTLCKQRVFSQHQQLVRFDYGVYQKITPRIENKIIEKITSLYPHCEGIIISDYEYGAITDTVKKAVEKLQKKYHKIIVVDAKQPGKYKSLSPFLSKPNFQEIMHLLKVKKPSIKNRVSFVEKHKNTILEKTGAELVAVTMDSEGSLLLQKNSDSIYSPTLPTDNAKAAGAGDTYTAAFALSLASHADFLRAAQVAALAANIVIKQNHTATCKSSDLYTYLLPEEKVITHTSIEPVIQHLKQQNKRIVFTNGCFDILHSGHITYLQEAKKLGDILIVGINSDESVKRLKGSERPINNLEDRMKVLSGLTSIDFLIPFTEDTPINLIKKIYPDVYVKGGDYTRETLPEAPIIESMGGEVVIIPFIKNHSTTQIITQIRQTIALSPNI